MNSTRKSHPCGSNTAGLEDHLCKLVLQRQQLCCALVLFFTCVFSVFSLQANPSITGYEFAESDFLLRISAQNHDSGIYSSAKSLASLFNWQQLSDEYTSGGQQRAIPISTTSAESSLKELVERRSELAIVRADLADQLFSQSNDSGELDSNALRLVSTHTPEFLHIVVRSDFDGATVKSLDGKRINIGGESDTVQRDLKKLLYQAGCYLADTEFIHAPVADALLRLEAGTLDAVMFYDQAPSKLVTAKLESLEYRLLPYSEIRDGGVSRHADPDRKYYGQALSTDFYMTPHRVRSLTLATYLLTRNDVPRASIEPIVQLLNIQPQTDINASPTEEGGTHLRPYSISESLSPIPLHPSSQLLIDIFSDPATLGNREDTVLDEKSGISPGQAEQ